MTKFAKKAPLAEPTEGAKKALKVVGKVATKKAVEQEDAAPPAKPAKVVKTAKVEKPAAKPAKGKAAAPAKEKAERAPDNRKIKLLEKKNPKREGSASYERYDLYKTSKTVAEFIEAGGTAGDVRHDEAKGYIELN